jgi:transposase
MYLRRCQRSKDGKRHAYWALVESYRTARGPRQRTVAWLGEMEEAARLGVQAAACGGTHQPAFGEPEPQYQRIDPRSIQVEAVRDFGAAWVGLELARQLDLVRWLAQRLPAGREEVPQAVMALVLVLCRLAEPSSELRIAEHLFGHSALAQLLGVSEAKVNDDRLYRALDALLPHKAALESHLKQRLGELFWVSYDLLLYDMTSTYFEGQALANPQAQRGYSRDHRPDCKQVTIALVVSRCGLPLGYEVFAGNRADVTTVEEIVELIEGRYGRADRVWVMDRGMVSQANVAFLKEGGRQYILGTPKSLLKKYAREWVHSDWQQVHEGLEVQKVPAPDGGDETFILCRSAARREKEQAMHARFLARIEDGLTRIAASCAKGRQDPVKVGQRVGRLLGQNTRGAGAFTVQIGQEAQGGATLAWTKDPTWQDWASRSEGCYLLRTNIADWAPAELWQAYMQLSEAEGAFRIHKSDLGLRPVWHQKESRVQAHILVCFLAYVLWKTLGRRCHQAGLGDQPRKVLDELSRIRLVDVVMRTDRQVELRRRCVSRPTAHQQILLDRLGLTLPDSLPLTEEAV